MAIFRPGGHSITEDALNICGFKPGAVLLDIGCGEGETVEFLQARGFSAEGIDKSERMISRGLKRNPSLNIRKGDGEYLEDYDCYAFDGIFMECTLSLLDMQTEALHEAYCVLKKGGMLVISDLYAPNPEPEEVEKMQREASEARSRPHQEGDCENRAPLPSEYCLEGAFVKEALIAGLEDLGFEIAAWKVKNKELKEFIGQAIFDYGSLEEYFKQAEENGEGCICKAFQRKKLGYFLLVAQKPAV